MNDEQTPRTFEQWWEEDGQFSRAGGGDYEKTFAFNAWQASAALRAPVALAAAGEARTDGAPAEIWLQLHGDGGPDGEPVDYTDGVSWCWHKVHEHDVRYVLSTTTDEVAQK